MESQAQAQVLAQPQAQTTAQAQPQAHQVQPETTAQPQAHQVQPQAQTTAQAQQPQADHVAHSHELLAGIMNVLQGVSGHLASIAAVLQAAPRGPASAFQPAAPAPVSAFQPPAPAPASAFQPAAPAPASTFQPAGRGPASASQPTPPADLSPYQGFPDEDEDPESLCGVCRSAAEVSYFLDPCGHFPYCMTCIASMEESKSHPGGVKFRCPQCQKNVDAYFPLRSGDE